MLFNAFQPQQPVDQQVRLPLGVANHDGSFSSNIPATLSVQLRGPDGKAGAPMVLQRHQRDLPRGYYPLTTTFPTVGTWTIEATLDGKAATSTVDVKAANEIAAVPGPGQKLPKLQTPTDADHRGVNPICTRNPECPFHSQSLDQVLGNGKPVALLVSTPAFCQVAICGPVLDLFVNDRAKYQAKGLQIVHAEVYVDDQAKQTTPTVDALGLEYEPALFLARGDGTVSDRLDYIFDRDELDAAVAKLS